MNIREIAALVHGEMIGDGAVEITRVAKIEEAEPGDLTFLANPKYERFLASTRASAVLISSRFDPSKYQDRPHPVFIKVRDPYLAFLLILKTITPIPDPFPAGIHPTAVVANSATLGAEISLGAHVVVGEGAVIGDRTRISHGCVVGDRTVIGSECRIHPNVTVYHDCRIGNRVILHAGSVIGSDGFGFAPKPDGTYEKIPQLGSVLIEDDVEIGANCTIDRATLGETRIRRGVKLDNLVHLAHNVVVGENTVIAAQTGVSGSSKIGKNVMIGGQVGIAGHLEIADNTVLLAQSGVSKSLTAPGKVYLGYPAKEQKRAHRIEGALRSLPELLLEVRQLQQEVAALRAQFGGRAAKPEQS